MLHCQAVAQLVKPAEFIPNHGQWDAPFLYKAGFGPNTVYLEKNGFTFRVGDPTSGDAVHSHLHQPDPDPLQLRHHAFSTTFVDADPNALMTGEEFSMQRRSYFLGSDSLRWKGNIQPVGRVRYQNIYEGVDVVCTSDNGNFRYDFFIQPNADPAQIKCKYDGVDHISIRNQSLILATSLGEITVTEPYAYQEIDGDKQRVLCRYRVRGNVVSFDFPNGYDVSQTLIIDPTVVFATTVGSPDGNLGYAGTYDDAGNFYVAGKTWWFDDYPTTLGAYQTVNAGSSDIAVSVFDATGSNLLYSTLIGGTSEDIPHSLVVDPSGNLVLVGHTTSPDFPTTANAFQPAAGGFYDFAVVKFNPTLSSLVGATYVGGSGWDAFNSTAALSLRRNFGDVARSEVIVDAAGDVFVAGNTWSSDYPVTSNAAQSSYGGSEDGCVFKLNYDLSALLWSTFIGGADNDAAYGLTFGNTVNTLYVTGGTVSSNFPTTSGAYQTTHQGGVDGFVAKYDIGGTFALERSTTIGLSDYDQTFLIQTDLENNVYVLGQTLSGDFPVTAGVYSNPYSPQFLMQLDSNLAVNLASTVFGSGDSTILNIAPTAFLVDSCGNAYVSGWGGTLNNVVTPTNTTGMPVTSDAFQPTTDGQDYYFAVFSPGFQNLTFASFYGGVQPSNVQGEHVDGGISRFNENGVLYQAVCTGCDNTVFPITPGAYSDNPSGDCNVSALKIDFGTVSSINASAAAMPDTVGCAPFIVQFQNNSVNATTYFWDFGDGTTSTLDTPTHTYATAGTHLVILVGFNDSACVPTDTAFLTITVLDSAALSLGNDTLLCNGEPFTINPQVANAAFAWQDGSTDSIFVVTNSGTYALTVIYAGGCSASDSIVVAVNAAPSIELGNDTTVCSGQSITLTASPLSANLIWQDGSTANTFAVNATGEYSVTATDTNGCTTSDSITVTVLTTGAVDLGNDTTICEGQLLILDATTPGAAYEWQDGSTSATYIVLTPGSFSVTISANGCIVVDSIDVSVIPSPNADLGSDTILCNGQFLTLDAGNVGSGYLWSTGETTQSIAVTQSGEYAVSVTALGCSVTDTVNVTFTGFQNVELGNDTMLCEGSFVILNTPTNPPYAWSTGETNQSITVGAAGTYWVQTGTGDCSASDTIIVASLPSPQISLGVDTSLCVGETLLLGAGASGHSFVWSTGTTSQTIAVTNPPQIVWLLTSQGQCITADTIVISDADCFNLGEGCGLFVPNAFSPNDDGINDLFLIIHCPLDNYRLNIYNRWGELVYTTDDPDAGWDGTFKRVPQPLGVFAYYLQATADGGERIFRKGNVTLLR